MDNNVLMEMTKEYSPVNRDAKLQGIMEKWSRTGLLKKLNEDKTQIVAQLLENQAVELRNVMLNEESQTGGIAGYNKIAFPLVRRVFGQLLAPELVAIQPMNLPSGLLFYLDFKYDRSNGGSTAGGSVYGDLNQEDNDQLDGVGAQDATGGFYNFQNVGYSRRNFQLVADDVAITSVDAGTPAGFSDLLGANVYAYDFALSNTEASDLTVLNQIRVTTSAALESAGVKTGETFRGLSALGDLSQGSTTATFAFDHYFGRMDPTMTTANTTAGTVRVFLLDDFDMSAEYLNSSTTGLRLVGPARTSVDTDAGTNNLGDFEGTPNIPEINIAVSSVPVQAVTRKLKATWTPELAQDINAYHAIDAEVELTTILSDIISTEIDREILSTLLAGATVSASWSRIPGKYTSGTITTNGLAPAANNSVNSGFTGTNQDWYQTLAETVLSVSNEIHKRTMRSGANWMVTSPDVATIIEAIAYFKPNATFDPTEVQYSMGIEKVGTLSNRFTVYKDPYFPANKILVGYKGAGFLDAGFVYAPYVPLVFTPTIFEPNDFTPRKGAMTRYASQMVRPEFYGVITVSDLSIVGV
jgi:hypothetical protein